jgi:hypothetical protein
VAALSQGSLVSTGIFANGSIHRTYDENDKQLNTVGGNGDF